MASDADSRPPAESVQDSSSSQTEPWLLGKYRVEKQIGAGGMGRVYLAVDQDLNRTVALKILPRDKAENPTLVRRFKAEAQAAAQLRHDNIVSVYEAGRIDDQLYIAFEYVEGTDVHQLISRRGVLPVRRSIEIVRQVALALEHAHSRSIVHRDIKPSNLLIRRDGTVKLADLGLARAVDDTAQTAITRAGTTVGTVDYMSPEQARDSKSADIRSDIYSLGCAWYHMLTGHPPFPEGSLTSKLQAHATKEPVDPRSENQAVTDAVVACIHRMMAKRQDDRYQTPAELLEDLSRATLSRETISTDVLAGLSSEAADEDDVPSSRGSSPAAGARSGSGNGKRGQRRSKARRRSPSGGAADAAEHAEATAPKTRRQRERGSGPQAPVTTPPPGSRPAADGPLVRLEPLKIAAVVLVTGGVIFGIQQLTSRFASGLDGAAQRNPFDIAATETDPDQSADPGTDDPGDGSTRTDNEPADSRNPRDRRDPDRRTGSDDRGGNSSGRRPASGSDTPAQPADPDHPVEFTLGREGERPWQPDWLGSVPALETLTQLATARKLDVVRVGRNAPNGPVGDFASIGTALESRLTDNQRLPGLVLLLQGEGPFELPPAVLQLQDLLAIAAEPGSQPVVFLRAASWPTQLRASGRDSSSRAEPHFRVRGGTLALLGLHLIATSSRPSDGPAGPLLSLNDTNLVIRQSSVTLLNESESGTAAASAAAQVVFTVRGGRSTDEDAEPEERRLRVLLDRLTFRARSATAVQLESRATDLVASNCLFFSETAPVLALNVPALSGRPPAVTAAAGPATSATVQPAAAQSATSTEAEPSTSKDRPDTASTETGRSANPPPVRPVAYTTRDKRQPPGQTTADHVLRLHSCTLVGGSQALRFQRAPAGTGRNATIAVQCVNSALASTGSGRAPTLLELTDWTPSTAAASSTGRVDGVSWTSLNSLLCGWERLVWSESISEYQCTGSSRWNLLWGHSGSSLRIRPAARMPQHDGEPAEWKPGDAEIDSSLAGTVRTTDNTLPGCLRLELTVPAPAALPRTRLSLHRPVLPDWLERPSTEAESENAHVIPFELNRRTSLARLVASGDWPDGTIIVARGSGTVAIEPVVLKRRRLTIRFEDDGSDALWIEPQSKSGAAPALFHVADGGSLRLEGARINMPRATRKQDSFPPWVFRMAGNGLALAQCTVNTPRFQVENFTGVVDWPAGTTPSAAGRQTMAPPGHYDTALLIEDTWIAGEGLFLRAPLERRAIVLRNSAIAMMSDLMQFDLTSANGNPDSAVEISSCTLATPGIVFDLKATIRDDVSQRPLRLFVDSTIFGESPQPQNDSPQEMIILQFVGNILDRSQVVWQGERNAWMTAAVRAYFKGPGLLPNNRPDYQRDFQQRWTGESSATGALASPGDVVLAEPLPHRQKLLPASYLLQPGCRAATWSVTGNILGARVEELSPAPATKEPPKKNERRPGRTRLTPRGRQSSQPGF